MIGGVLSQNIRIGPTTIGKLLKEERLEVPPSQRSYRWKEEHADDLFRDMRTAIDDDTEEYFLGSVVSIETDGRILIYDGQQRLATTMILIAAIRNALIEMGNEKDAAITERSYLFSQRRGSDDTQPHLTLNLEDRDHFATRILPRVAQPQKRAVATRQRDSHKRMEKIAKAAKEFVSTAIIKVGRPVDSDKNLNKWLDFIEKSLHVIWVQVTDERTAFTIFETMNDRGLKLSAADLLKNYLHATAAKKREEIVHKWSSMAAILETVEGEEEDLVEYIRCFWVSRHGHTRSRYLYDRIKEKTTNSSKAVELVTDLETSAQDYAAIVMSSHERTTDRGALVISSIETLKVLGVTQLRPMLLSAFSKFKPGQFETLAKRSVSWSVRFLIAGTPSGTIEGYYSKIAERIWSGKISTADGATGEIKPILPNDDEFRVAFANASEQKEKIARYYLHALQKAEDGRVADHALTLEHILPKQSDSNWEHFSAEEHRENLHRIGNLALLEYEDNGGVQGTGYDAKKLVLANPKNGSLTQAAAQFSSWGVAEIAKRQAQLSGIAIKAWPI